MTVVVYLDLVILANFLMDYCLIAYTGVVNRQIIKTRRLVASSLIALSGLALFYLPYKFLFLILRVFVSCGFIYVAFPYKSIRQYLQNLLIFYFLNYLTAGVLISYEFSLTANTVSLFYNYAPTWYFLGISFVLANILTYVFKLSTDNLNSQKLVTVGFSLFGQEFLVKGLIDTGNQAASLSCQRPVVFVADSVFTFTIDEELLSKHNITFTYLVVESITGKTLKLVFKPDSFYLIKKGKRISKEIYLAVMDGVNCADKPFSVLLQPQILT